MRRPATSPELHDATRLISPDPLPDNPGGRLDQRQPCKWVYRRGQFELALLHRLVRESYEVNRFVDYVLNFGDLMQSNDFRCALSLSGGTGTIRVRTTGSLSARVDGVPVDLVVGSDGWHRITVAPTAATLVLHVDGPTGSPATFALDAAEPLATHTWEASSELGWEPTLQRPGKVETPPHVEREPTVVLSTEPHHREGVYTLATPVLGKPVVHASAVELISTGESLHEALDSHLDQESRHEHLRLRNGVWTSHHELGFQFVSVDGSDLTGVQVEASAHPVPRRGAFLCSDETLSRIWTHSAYTLRLCMHGLMIDGIKRDRLPWAGDQAITTMANAYAFADADIARDSIVALGQPRHGYVNGISDYSLWWLINSALYANYFGDVEHVRREAETIAAFLGQLIENHTTPEGLFRPASQTDSFIAENGSIFIDWGVEVDPDRTLTVLQVLWFWALHSAAEILQLVNHPSVRSLAEHAERVRAVLMSEAWDPKDRFWREYLGESTPPSPYPNTLAVLSGLDNEPTPAVVAALHSATQLTTPFMSTFALRALAVAGEPEEVTSIVRTRWGAMLDAGASTFWEEFERSPEERYSMYDRPYGMSLCHAWAAGPAAILPETVLGVRPLTPGWTSFTVDPRLGDLRWAAAAVPVPQGEIFVLVADGRATVVVPAGCTLVVDNQEASGPHTLTWAIDGPQRLSAMAAGRPTID